MKFILGYRTELFIIFLVPIRALRRYRFLRYDGTDSCATMVPFDRYYQLSNISFLIRAAFERDIEVVEEI